MKKILAQTLVLCLLLCGCGGNKPAETQAPATDPAAEVQPTAAPTEAAPETEATTEPAPEVYTHPLTGEILEAPLENRIIAVTICNLEDAIPHRGVTDADMYFESKGGWGLTMSKTNDVLGYGEKYYETGDGLKVYDEGVKYLKFKETIKDLLNMVGETPVVNDVYYVYDISKYYKHKLINKV